MRSCFFSAMFFVSLAAFACGGDDDGTTLSNGATNDPSATGSADAGAGPINGCSVFEDDTAGSVVTIAWSPAIAGTPGACIKVKKGTSVEWSGDLTQFPLKGSGGAAGNPISSHVGGLVTFGKVGIYGFACETQPTMMGAVQVVE